MDATNLLSIAIYKALIPTDTILEKSRYAIYPYSVTKYKK